MRVRVIAFARLRELLGGSVHEVEVPEGCSAEMVWEQLEADHRGIAALRASTRIARNGMLSSMDQRLAPNDELALLPPAGGG